MLQISQQIQQAITDKSQLHISTKSRQSNTLDMSSYQQLVSYHPQELVITVQSGMQITELMHILSKNKQALGFSTQSIDTISIGAAYALGGGLLRDFVLGVKIIDGRGDILNFGGQVMKNVAGYDVARLLVGSAGQLAVIAEISFKILPKTYTQSLKSDVLISPKRSAVRTNIEKGLKQVFDPYDIFI